LSVSLDKTEKLPEVGAISSNLHETVVIGNFALKSICFYNPDPLPVSFVAVGKFSLLSSIARMMAIPATQGC
jgi:hypothetical protein